MNSYELPHIINNTIITRGYPPAIMYSFGLGRKPTNMHAAFIDRIIQSLPNSFNITKFNEWRNLTNNPSLLHISILNGFFDGTYLLIERLHHDITEQDHYGCNSLHIAVWLGDLFVIQYLLNRNSSLLLLTDNYGRISLHYAIIRQQIEVIALLLSINDTILIQQMLNFNDKYNQNSFHLANLNPINNDIITIINMSKNNFTESDDNIIIESNEKINSQHNCLLFDNSNFNDNNNDNNGWNNELSNQKICYNLTPIDSIDSFISIKAFKQKYYHTQRPLLFKNQLFSNNNIWAYIEKAIFIERYGDIHIKTGEKLYSEFNAWNIPSIIKTDIKDFIENIMETSNWIGFTELSDNSLINNDIIIPKIFQICGNSSNSNNNNPLKLYIGSKDSGTPIHSHNSSWNLLITGQKLWFLIPYGTIIDPKILNYATNEGLYHIYTVIEWIELNLDSFENVFVVLQLPGEVIYIPHQWYHMTLNLMDNIAISQEFCLFYNNNDMRYTSIGHVLYGDYDSFENIGSYNSYSKGPTISRESFDNKQIPIFN